MGQEYRDIYVADKVMVQRTTLGGPSSRMIAVGHPGGFNFAFNAVNCAPMFAWYGGYLDFSGETNGRGGKGSKILGIQRSLGTDAVPFRVGSAEKLPETLEFHGYRRDNQSGDPTFLFEVDGVSVEQRLTPKGSDTISIDLVFPGSSNAKKFYLLDPEVHSRVQLGKGLRWSAPGVIEISARIPTASFELSLKETTETFIRKVPDLSGAQVFQNFCSACHSMDGTKLIGPTFKELLGRNQTVIRDGKTEHLVVDEEYLRESVMKPQAAVVKGYEEVPMADFSSVITEEQMDRLITYLQELD